jgi:UPF0755 protein
LIVPELPNSKLCYSKPPRLFLKSFIRSVYLSLFVLVILLSLTLGYLFLYFPHTSLNSKKDIKTVEVLAGSSVKGIAKQLEDENILTPLQARVFCWWIKFRGTQSLLQAGVYAITLDVTPQKLLEKFVKGDVAQYALTLHEGQTIFDVLVALNKHPAIKNCLADKSHEELMSFLGEPHLFAEGLFFPDTYYFNANTTDIAFLRRARQAMQEKLDEAWEQRDPDILLKTPYEALILASIIEKETSNEQERFIISGVFHRRIEKNMRLQADPTVGYGVREFKKPLTKAHLRSDTPYNTYLYKGLPPTPIGLPSIQSIIAALHPQKGEALYFVAKGDGTHQFSATLEEHNEAVANYRRGLKQ